jgi:hypothetical protein
MAVGIGRPSAYLRPPTAGDPCNKVARRPNESAGDAISVYRLAFREALSRPGLTSGIGTELPISVVSGSVSHWGQSGPQRTVVNILFYKYVPQIKKPSRLSGRRAARVE